MYSDAHWVDRDGHRLCIRCKVVGSQLLVPLDEANADYAAIMALVAEGKLVIAEPETP